MKVFGYNDLVSK